MSDRHDNIGIDGFAAEVAKAAGAKMLIDAGDDTSSGQSWEVFSINSLRQHFKDFKVVAVAGNHDAGGHVEDAMRKNGFTVLDSKPVEVEGIRFLGDSDPTRTGLGSADSPGDETIARAVGAARGHRLRPARRQADLDVRGARPVVVRRHRRAGLRDTAAVRVICIARSGPRARWSTIAR